MILQCDQCQTKFRLDDSKMKPGGVKVRCSKCRHVFVAGVEAKQEESDFDAILSGLGGGAPQKPEEQTPAAEPEGFGFEEEPKAPAAAAPAPAAPAPAPESAAAPAVSEDDFPDFSTFGFPEGGAAAEQKPTTEKDVFGEFDLSDFGASPAPKEEPAAAPSGLDFGEFSFDEQPAAVEKEKEATAPPAEEGFDFGDFPFEAEPAPEPEAKAAAAPATGLDFGEIQFNPEPVTNQPEPAAAAELDFGEFSFNEEPLVQGEAAHAPKEFDFGDFSFEGEAPAAAPQQGKPAPAPEEELMPEGFSFEEEPEPTSKPAVSAPAEEFSFGDFSFEEVVPKQEEKPAAPPRQDEEFVLGDFSFSEAPEEAPPAKVAAAAPEWGGAELPGFDLGAAPKAGGWGAPAAEAPAEEPSFGPAAAPPQPAEPVAPVIPPPPAPDKAAKAPSFDFDFGPPPTTAEAAAEEEELPPLSISSRRKGRSVFSVSLVAVAVLIILALSGAGLYLLQKGPAAAQTFEKLGLGFVGKWFGVEAPEEGKITIRNPQATFYQNKEAGELFVVSGEAQNSYKKPRASIHVKVSVFDKKGAVIMHKTAYCGNRLSKEQLETLPMAKLDAIMNNQFGDSLANIGVQPGQAVGFVVALQNVPKDAADFGVEVVGSTVSTGK